MNPGAEKGYALDFSSPVRHVATEMERARLEGRAVSIDEMAATYSHPIPGDLSRVQLHHNLTSNAAAARFLLESAVEHLGNRVQKVDGGYRLARPLKGMRYPPGSSGVGVIAPVENPYRQFNDPFNPMSGAFSDNIRKLSGRDSMEELRESMRTVGWLPHHPAIQDERGVVLVGHRRLAIAKELDIPVRPVHLERDGIVGELATINLGNGDEADSQRFRIAVYSNIGSKPFTPDERARIALYLYKEREWSMARIAEALSVSQPTVSKDLRGVMPEALLPSRGGRPRKPITLLDPDQRQTITPEQRETILKLAEEGVAQRDIAERVGLSDIPIRRVVEHERGRREAIREERERQEVALIERRTHACPKCGTVHVIGDTDSAGAQVTVLAMNTSNG